MRSALSATSSRIVRVLFYSLLALAGLVMLWFAIQSEQPAGAVPGRPVRTVSRIQVENAAGEVRDYDLPVTLKTGEPFAMRFRVPAEDRQPADVVAVQTNYMDFTVWFDGAPIYEYQVGDRTFIKSGGYLLHFIPLRDCLTDGTIEIRATPRPPHLYAQKLNVLYVGSPAQITLDRLGNDLPVLMISLVIILFFIGMVLLYPRRRPAGRADYMMLFHMAFLGLIVTGYILLQTWTVNRLLRDHHLLVYVLEFTLLSVLPLPVLLILRQYTQGKLRRLLTWNVRLLCLNLLAQYVLSLSGIREMREMLPVTHALFGVCFIVVIVVLYDMRQHRTPETSAVLLSVLPLLAISTAGMVVYMITGLLLTPLVLQIPFVVFLMAQAVAAMERYAQLRENAMKIQTYQQLASTDLMTGLDNRNAFNELSNEVADTHQAAWVVMMDLNNLKRVNDIYGHRVGDELITAFAQRMQQEVQALSGSRMYRVGGDEFLLYALEPQSFAMDDWLAGVRNSFEDGWPEDLAVRPEFSYGAFYHAGLEPLGAAVRKADQRMYADKSVMRQADAMM